MYVETKSVIGIIYSENVVLINPLPTIKQLHVKETETMYLIEYSAYYNPPINSYCLMERP